MSESYIVGEVLTTFFENPQNFYKVMLLRVIETNCQLESDEIVVTGIFGQIHLDIPYRFNGKVVSHPKYGQQFSAISYQQNQPTGKKGLIAYFSSGRFPGIGEKTAEKIVEQLGEEAIDIIIADEEALTKVPGLSTKKCESIREIILENQGTERVMFELTNLGFTPVIAQKIITLYKDKTSEILRDDPYLFLRSIEGLGFRRVDAIAQKLEIEPDHISRIKGAVFVVVRDFCYQSGHTYLLDRDVIQQAQRLLEMTRSYLIEADAIVNGLNELIREGVIIAEENRLSLSSLFYAEIGIVNAIQHLTHQNNHQSVEEEELSAAIQHAEQKFQIQYDDSQKQALRQIIQEPLFILTGGPGTGKTTIINGAVEVYHYLEEQAGSTKSLDEMIQLAAPTGRAAKRMNELTGLSASTIHRLLGISADAQETDTESYEEREVTCDFLIVDEMSMVDTWLMNRLLKAVSPKTKLLLVGDKNQLPSVGPGQVLEDLLNSHRIPSIELTQIHRQTNASSIVPLAHAIKEGHLPQDFVQAQADRSFIACRSSQLLTVIEQIVTKALQKGYSKKDIQVLAPMYKGEAGIHEINRMMQQILNPKIGNSVREIEHFDRVFRVGDKVLQLVNVAEENIYNGDIGEITAIIFAKENEDQVDKIFVAFENVEVEYTRQDFQQLTHAYCCSIHKAQGSEFKMVILPMLPQYQRMLQRNLLYTAVTRSKQFLILCGQYEAFQVAAKQEGEQRQTHLRELLSEKETSNFKSTVKTIDFEVAEEMETYQVNEQTLDSKTTANQISEKVDGGRLTISQIIEQAIDPLIGMGELTPYSFMK